MYTQITQITERHVCIDKYLNAKTNFSTGSQ